MTKNKNCPKCKETKPLSEFYKRRSGTQPSVYCKSCTIEQTIERQRLFKRRCIEYKGGKCIRCNYDKCDAALEFHHTNPSEKDFSVAHARLTKFSIVVTKELDKCLLLCANCHREIHSQMPR